MPVCVVVTDDTMEGGDSRARLRTMQWPGREHLVDK